ncbi:MAG: hypothetical protein HKN68_15070 [Saprospiraceae bacterium]|nr:hypothetical protein [Saprospiraceae bacterium]
MKSLALPTILIAIASIILMAFTPWWIVAVIGFIVALLTGLKPGQAFLSGLLAISIVWMIAAVIADSGNQISVAEMMSEVIGGLPPVAVIIVTGLMGGIVSGLGAMSGVYARYIWKPHKT